MRPSLVDPSFCPSSMPFFGQNAPSHSLWLLCGCHSQDSTHLATGLIQFDSNGSIRSSPPRNWLLCGDTQALEVTREDSGNVHPPRARWTRPDSVLLGAGWFSKTSTMEPTKNSFNASLFWLKLLRVGFCCLHQRIVTDTYTYCPSIPWLPPSLYERNFFQVSLVITILGTNC